MIAIPVKRRAKTYKYVQYMDVEYITRIKGVEFKNDWFEIDKSGLVLVRGVLGYAFDGCSPKFNFFDLFLIGTSDGRIGPNTNLPILYYAALIHDVLYQFGKKLGIKRKVIDKIFLFYLGDFKLRYIYYLSVRLFGWIYFGRDNDQKI